MPAFSESWRANVGACKAESNFQRHSSCQHPWEHWENTQVISCILWFTGELWLKVPSGKRPKLIVDPRIKNTNIIKTLEYNAIFWMFSLHFPKVQHLKNKKKTYLIPSSCYPFNYGFLMNKTEVITNHWFYWVRSPWPIIKEHLKCPVSWKPSCGLQKREAEVNFSWKAQKPHWPKEK